MKRLALVTTLAAAALAGAVAVRPYEFDWANRTADDRPVLLPLVDAAAVMADDGGVTIFAVNRDLAEPAELTCDLRSFGAFSGAAHSVLHHDDVKAVNTELNPDNVKPVSVPVDLKDGKVILPAASWNVIHLTK